MSRIENKAAIDEYIAKNHGAPTDQWTPRERWLREALEDELSWKRTSGPCQYPHVTRCMCNRCVRERSIEALSGPTPPPDPRDAALEKAERALEYARCEFLGMRSRSLNDAWLTNVAEKGYEKTAEALAAIRAARGKGVVE